MKRYMAAELRRTGQSTKSHSERTFKRWYASLPAKERGKRAAEAKQRWFERLGPRLRRPEVFG